MMGFLDCVICRQIKSLAGDVERSLSLAGTTTAETLVTSAREAQTTLTAASTEATNLVPGDADSVLDVFARGPLTSQFGAQAAAPTERGPRAHPDCDGI